MSTELSPDRILNLAYGFWPAKVLLSAAELGLFTVLAREPMDAEALRQRVGIDARSARDFFDALVAMEMLERDGERYSNAPEADLYLDRAKPSYVGGLLEMLNARLYPFWGSLTDALRTGKPQNEASHGGVPMFETLYRDPERLRLFARAMTANSAPMVRVIAGKFRWERHRSVVDVGTAEGALPVAIALAHPHIGGGGFDLPPVEPLFREYVEAHGLTARLKFYPGDFFKDPLPSADVLVMGRVLHGCSLDQRRMLVRKAFEALPRGGALIVQEALIDDDRRRNLFGLLMSLNMLIETSDGANFTGAECSQWMREAHFSDTRVEHLVGPEYMVVGVK